MNVCIRVRHIIHHTNDTVLNLDKLTYAGNLESLATIETNSRYTFVQADICDAEKTAELCSKFQPDIMMHLAAESHVDRSIDGPAEFMQTNINQEGLKICACNISKIYHQLTPLAKRIVGVFVFLLLTFLLLMYNDYAMSAGATGASCLLSLLCFIVLKRDDKWDNGQRKGKYVMIQRYQDKLKLRNRKELEKKSKQEEEKKKTK